MSKNMSITELNPGERIELCGNKWTVLDANLDGGVLILFSDFEKITRCAFDPDLGEDDYRLAAIKIEVEKICSNLPKDAMLTQSLDFTANNGDLSLVDGNNRSLFGLLSADQCRKYRQVIPVYKESFSLGCSMWTLTPNNPKTLMPIKAINVFDLDDKSLTDALSTSENYALPTCLLNPEKLVAVQNGSETLVIEKKDLDPEVWVLSPAPFLDKMYYKTTKK